jgi:hypothetical protein
MPSDRAARSNPIRDVLRIGQVWEHDGNGYCVRITQIHRADRLVEACYEAPDGHRSRAVTFSELRRDYTLVH